MLKMLKSRKGYLYIKCSNFKTCKKYLFVNQGPFVSAVDLYENC